MPNPAGEPSAHADPATSMYFHVSSGTASARAGSQALVELSASGTTPSLEPASLEPASFRGSAASLAASMLVRGSDAASDSPHPIAHAKRAVVGTTRAEISERRST